MTTTELIDRLCAVVEAQSGIIRKQAFFIEEQLAVDEATKMNLHGKESRLIHKLTL